MLASVTANCQNSYTRTIKESLDIVRISLDKPYISDYSSVMKASRLIIALTGIPSSSDGNYGGQLPPNSQDFYRWTDWLEKNLKYQAWTSKYSLPMATWLRPYPGF